ncbi:actin-1-like [Aricia agestis]|uniref:actin-1-like n=1 Tax=Aricia agestis TaxID=91739 RepID=UPI001C203520|nr:actin-1-like [Aricia agestis]
MAFENPAIVIDNGSYMIKAGFACDNHPVSMFRTLVGRPENVYVELKTDYYDVYVGNEVVERIDDLVVNKPVVRSLIVDWDDMERVWYHIFYKELRVAPEDRAVIMGVASKSSMEERIQCFETSFETLNVPALCIQSQSVLGMYGSGLTTGICVDMGHDTTNVVPVYEARTIKYAQIETGVAGRQISEYMRRCLHECCDLKSATDMEVLKRTCYVTKDCAMPIKDCTRKYKLPSGEEIDVSNECFMAAEMIFQPDLVIGEETGYIPLHEAVVTAVSKCDSELHSQLYDGIVLCGGLAMVKGTAKRLHCEFENKVNEPIQIRQSPECYATPWLGGAVFAGLDGARDMWIEKEQYEEHGHRIIKNKRTF